MLDPGLLVPSALMATQVRLRGVAGSSPNSVHWQVPSALAEHWGATVQVELAPVVHTVHSYLQCSAMQVGR